jgi:hypothetical protein
MTTTLLTKPGNLPSLLTVMSIFLSIATFALAQEPAPAAQSAAQPLNAAGATGAGKPTTYQRHRQCRRNRAYHCDWF